MNPSEEDTALEGFIRQLAKHTESVRAGRPAITLIEFVAQHGRSWERGSLTKEEALLVKQAAGRKRFALGQCFNNAQRLVLGDKTGTLQYVEGFVFRYVPIHHGWATINNKIIDVTIRPDSEYFDRRSKGIRGDVPAYLGYFGVLFKRAHLSGKRDAWSLLDDMKNGWPYLVGARKLEDK